jgi:hypothetical protein
VTKRAHRLRRLAPWLSAAVLLSVLFARVDFAATAQAFARADWTRFVLCALPFVSFWLVLDACSLSRLIARFHRPIALREMLRLRGGTYLFLALSYDAAQAALALALSRSLRIPLLALGGTFLFYYAVDVATIAALGSLGALALPGVPGAALQRTLAALLALVIGAFLVGAWLGRRSGARVLGTLERATPRDVAEWLGWRALFHVSFVGFSAATLPAFDIHVPLAALVACVPVTLSIAALPITVAGLGSAQLAMIALYGGFADEAAIVAYSLAHSASLIALRLPIGVACWPALATATSSSPDPLLEERSPTCVDAHSRCA